MRHPQFASRALRLSMLFLLVCLALTVSYQEMRADAPLCWACIPMAGGCSLGSWGGWTECTNYPPENCVTHGERCEPA